MKTLYEQLGVTPQASPTAIQQSFYRLANKFDPKRPGNQGNSNARVQYLAVRDAYRTLSDAESRRQYDLSLQTRPVSQRARATRDAGGTQTAIQSTLRRSP